MIQGWDLENMGGRPIKLAVLEDNLGSVAIDPTGRWLAATSNVNTNSVVQVWDMTDFSKRPHTLTDHEDYVLAVAFDPQGKVLATAGGGTPFQNFKGDTATRFWDTSNFQTSPIVMENPDEVYWVTTLAFDPKNRWLAFGGPDQLGGLAFGGTDRFTGEDTAIYLRRSLAEIQIFACEQAGRNFTWEEWQEFLPGQPYEKTCVPYPVHCSVPDDEWPADFWEEQTRCADS